MIEITNWTDIINTSILPSKSNSAGIMADFFQNLFDQIFQKMSGISRKLDLLCRWLLAIIFLYAGIPKLLGLHDFAGVVNAYGLLPEVLAYPVAAIVASMEVVVAAGLVLKKKFALHLTLVLLSIFIGVLIYGIVMGLDIDCGCFAQDDPEFKAFSSLKIALIRDLILLVPLMYLYLQSTLIHVLERKLKNEKL